MSPSLNLISSDKETDGSLKIAEIGRGTCIIDFSNLSFQLVSSSITSDCILERKRDAIGFSVCKGYIMSNDAESILGSCTTKEHIITESDASTKVANCGLISLD